MSGLITTESKNDQLKRRYWIIMVDKQKDIMNVFAWRTGSQETERHWQKSASALHIYWSISSNPLCLSRSLCQQCTGSLHVSYYFLEKKTAVVISGVSSREKRAKNMNLYVKQICCRCRCNWLEGEASFPHTHTQQIVQIEEKEVCKCTKPPNKSNETFPYQIAVNIQCSLTFSCMCSLFLCVYFHWTAKFFVYLLFHAHSLSQPENMQKTAL